MKYKGVVIYENTNMSYVAHADLPAELMSELIKLPVKNPIFSMNIQPPGSHVPAHEDTWRIWYDKYSEIAKQHTFEDTVFYITFLTLQETGHFFQAGTTNMNWEPGDVCEMPHYCTHATANSGYTEKVLVQCLGIKK